jgi:hypothetical protein
VKIKFIELPIFPLISILTGFAPISTTPSTNVIFTSKGLCYNGITLLQRSCKRRVIGLFLYLQIQKSRCISTLSITQVKDKYKIKNRQAYNKSLCQRGSLGLWLEESVMEEWDN